MPDERTDSQFESYIKANQNHVLVEGPGGSQLLANLPADQKLAKIEQLREEYKANGTLPPLQLND